MNVWKDTDHKAPIMDLALLNHKSANVEVLVCDYDIDKHDFDNSAWDKCRSVAKFKEYKMAKDFAILLADHQFYWTGGVLIR